MVQGSKFVMLSPPGKIILYILPLTMSDFLPHLAQSSKHVMPSRCVKMAQCILPLITGTESSRADVKHKPRRIAEKVDFTSAAVL